MFLNSFLDGRIELMKRRKDKINFPYNNKRVFFIGLVIAAIAISGILAIFLYSAAVHKVNTNINIIFAHMLD